LLKDHVENLKKKEPSNPYILRTPPEDPRLHTWLTNQRLLHRKRQRGQKISPTQKERFTKIKSLGISLDYNDAQWELIYRRLHDFYKQHNSFPLSTTIDPHNQRDLHLLTWCNTQKEEYASFQQKNGTASGITQERIDRLDAIGFEWNDKEMVETKGYKELLTYTKSLVDRRF
jgi:hypothetical protein